MSYYHEQSELSLAKRQTLFGICQLVFVLIFAYILPDDIQGFSRVLVIGVPLFIAFLYFLTGLHALRKKNLGNWVIHIDDSFFILEYPSGSSFKCKLSDIKSCRRVRYHSTSRINLGDSFYLLFFDSTYRPIKLGFKVNYVRVIEELKKHTSIEYDVENRDTGDKFPYENFLKSEGLKRKGLIKAHWK